MCLTLRNDGNKVRCLQDGDDVMFECCPEIQIYVARAVTLMDRETHVYIALSYLE